MITLEMLKLIAPNYDFIEITDTSVISNNSFSNNTIGVIFQEKVVSSTYLICNIRIAEDLQDGMANCPIIILSYRTMRSIIKSEKYPRLIVSMGVYHVKLPSIIEEIRHTFDTAARCRIDKPRDAVREYLPLPGEMTRVESSIIHDLGNFFGSEKLLYGACFAGRISGKEALETIKRIRIVQNEESKLNKTDLELYRLKDRQIYDQLNKRYYEKDTSNIGIKGNILLIDDLAHLGWSDAIAASLWENENLVKEDMSENGLRITEVKCSTSKCFLRSISNADCNKEDEFINSLKESIKNYITDDVDIILLDLRLRRVEDEKTVGLEKMSGIEILEIIRAINAGIPIIMLTASRMAKNMDKVFNLGADDYLIKEMKIIDDEDAREYYKYFIESVSFALTKAYLGTAWKVIQWIENNYSEQKDENKFEQIRLMKKAIVFLKKKSYEFEKRVMGFDSIGNAVVELDKIKEIKAINYLITNSLDGGMLLQALRNVEAHAGTIRLDEFDAKVALYLTYRLFLMDEAVLNPFVEKAFKNDLINDIYNIFRESYSKIGVLLGKSYLEVVKLPLEQLKSQNKDDAKKKANLYTKYCVNSRNNKKIKLLYLFFLCRIPMESTNRSTLVNYSKYIKSDIIVLSNLLDRLLQMHITSTKLNGIIIPPRKLGLLCNIISSEIDRNIFCQTVGLGDVILNKIKKGLNVMVDFNIVRTGENGYFAIDIKQAEQ